MTTHIENLVKLPQSKTFIGSEFLTWLWYQSESTSMPMSVKKSGGKEYEVHVWIDDKVILESPLSQVHTNALKGGTPSQSPEAQIALQTGKSVKQAKIGMDISGHGEFIFTLDSQDLSPRGVKLPEIQGEDDEKSATIDIRIAQLEALSHAIDATFAQFINQRTKRDWEEQGLETIKKWIDTKVLPTQELQ